MIFHKIKIIAGHPNQIIYEKRSNDLKTVQLAQKDTTSNRP